MRRIYRISRNHIITGFIFLMPVLITLAVISRFWSTLLKMGNRVSKLIHVDSLLGANADAIMALVLFLLLCVIAGFLVKMTVFRKLSDALDQKLATFIPGYTDLRKQTEIKVGKGPKQEVFNTCLVETEGNWKPAYLVDVSENGDAVVFIPVAPTFNSGQVVVVPKGTYKKLNLDSNVLNSYLQKLGRGLKVSREELATHS